MAVIVDGWMDHIICPSVPLQLCRHVLHAFRVAALAQHVVIQRIAAPSLRLGRQQQSTVLALVAGDVEGSVQRHHPYRLLLARLWHYRRMTHTATRSEFPAIENKFNKIHSFIH